MYTDANKLAILKILATLLDEAIPKYFMIYSTKTQEFLFYSLTEELPMLLVDK